ncbi:hypothetical protein GTV32_09090 [Gordonia sp. SID5947]|uniref:hypothetical protein n=1 Tax=Gordonia sp. SID5947 TaxID=2690315 RepID=UPI00136FDE95|nr:hypothetical protein [Gordonia sp. SID5947]MYR06457.1 hypothetical protein [Gordonia sp. SID5947]
MATMSDAQVAGVLDRAVAGINPVLDTLAKRDPLGLKQHTFHDDRHQDSKVQRALHLLADALDVTDWPGTKGWSERSMNSRADWWMSRIGAVNNIAVAYPGLLGAWTRRLPLSSTLGFANQALVLVAIAREYGVTERSRQVELLAAVLCGRIIDRKDSGADTRPPLPTETVQRRHTLLGAVWETAKVLRALTGEIERRPGAPGPLRLLAYIPIVGAPATYIGERFALAQATRQARKWIADHPGAITSP